MSAQCGSSSKAEAPPEINTNTRSRGVVALSISAMARPARSVELPSIEPSLYLSTWSPARGPGPLILKTDDGRTFESTCEPGLVGLPVTTIRSMVPFKGRLYTTPAGSRGGNTNVSGHAVIYESRDPARGRWEPAARAHS